MNCNHADVSAFQSFFYAIGKRICCFLFECNSNLGFKMLLKGRTAPGPLHDKRHVWFLRACEATFAQFFASISKTKSDFLFDFNAQLRVKMHGNMLKPQNKSLNVIHTC